MTVLIDHTYLYYEDPISWNTEQDMLTFVGTTVVGVRHAPRLKSC